MVPTTSAGSRSGVNWMREKLMRRHSATVRTASVFARPGTPSSRMCPPVSSPIISRSTMTSWPTTRLATSRVMVCVSAASWVFAALAALFALRETGKRWRGDEFQTSAECVLGLIHERQEPDGYLRLTPDQDESRRRGWDVYYHSEVYNA